MLRTQGPGVQDNWDLWLNVSVFAYNKTVSSSTGVSPHYAMFRREATLPGNCVFPTPAVEKRTMYHWIERSARQKSEVEHPYVQTLDIENSSRMVGVVFWSESHPWDKS